MRLQPIVIAALIAAPLGAQARYTRPDVRFMQDMMSHHNQALVMAALISARTQRPEMVRLGERIMISQRDEIAAMRRWLIARHEEVPPVDADHGHGMTSMNGMQLPGMVSEAEMMQLEDATGRDFDRLFLTLMIRHHEGAMTMVKELLTSQGAGQESEIFRFTSDAQGDHRAELARMRDLLKTTAR